MLSVHAVPVHVPQPGWVFRWCLPHPCPTPRHPDPTPPRRGTWPKKSLGTAKALPAPSAPEAPRNPLFGLFGHLYGLRPGKHQVAPGTCLPGHSRGPPPPGSVNSSLGTACFRTRPGRARDAWALAGTVLATSGLDLGAGLVASRCHRSGRRIAVRVGGGGSGAVVILSLLPTDPQICGPPLRICRHARTSESKETWSWQVRNSCFHMRAFQLVPKAGTIHGGRWPPGAG